MNSVLSILSFCQRKVCGGHCVIKVECMKCISIVL
jgi:hypothetical protein